MRPSRRPSLSSSAVPEMSSEQAELARANGSKPPNAARIARHCCDCLRGREPPPRCRTCSSRSAAAMRRIATWPFDALTQWPNEAALGPLLELAREPLNEAQRVLVLRGAVRLLEKSQLPASKKADCFRRLAPLVGDAGGPQTPAERAGEGPRRRGAGIDFAEPGRPGGAGRGGNGGDRAWPPTSAPATMRRSMPR